MADETDYKEQYKRVYKELETTYNNLKKEIETTEDLRFINIRAYYTQIYNIVSKLESLQLYLLDEI